VAGEFDYQALAATDNVAFKYHHVRFDELVREHMDDTNRRPIGQRIFLSEFRNRFCYGPYTHGGPFGFD
jgi:hypothetical protein